MRVEWLPAALADRDAIIAYLEERNTAAAIELLQSLVLAGESLSFFPHRGRPGMAPGTRELVAVRPTCWSTRSMQRPTWCASCASGTARKNVGARRGADPSDRRCGRARCGPATRPGPPGLGVSAIRLDGVTPEPSISHARQTPRSPRGKRCRIAVPCGNHGPEVSRTSAGPDPYIHFPFVCSPAPWIGAVRETAPAFGGGGARVE